jgi:hypothetical protein
MIMFDGDVIDSIMMMLPKHKHEGQAQLMKRVPEVKSASVLQINNNDSFEVPDFTHAVTKCTSRERIMKEELPEFLSTFEGLIH